MKLEALEHPKVLDFAARLGVSLPTALGHLELLWAFTGKLAAQGNIGKWPDGAIARACHWLGDPEVFLQSLLQSRLLNAHTVHRYLVHDWADHAPRWVRAKLAKAGLQYISTAVATTERSTVGSSDDDDVDVKTIEPTTVATSKSSEEKRREGKTHTARARAPASGKSPDPPGPNAYGAMSIALRKVGVNINSIHPVLVAWVDDGFTIDQVLGAVAIARETKGDNERLPPNYLDTILRNPRKPNGSGNAHAKTPTRLSPGEAIEQAIIAGRSDEEIIAMPDVTRGAQGQDLIDIGTWIVEKRQLLRDRGEVLQ